MQTTSLKRWQANSGETACIKNYGEIPIKSRLSIRDRMIMIDSSQQDESANQAETISITKSASIRNLLSTSSDVISCSEFFQQKKEKLNLWEMEQNQQKVNFAEVCKAFKRHLNRSDSLNNDEIDNIEKSDAELANSSKKYTSISTTKAIANSSILSAEKKGLTSQLKPTSPISLQILQECNGSNYDLRELGEKFLQNKIEMSRILALSNISIKPINTISEAFFTEDVHTQLKQLRLQEVYTSQAYAW